MNIASADKAELVSYMTGLVSIMESKEDAGIARGRQLGREYNRCYKRLVEIITGEENEARQWQEHAGADKGRASVNSDLTGRSEPDREPRGPGAGGGGVDRRTGL